LTLLAVSGQLLMVAAGLGAGVLPDAAHRPAVGPNAALP